MCSQLFEGNGDFTKYTEIKNEFAKLLHSVGHDLSRYHTVLLFYIDFLITQIEIQDSAKQDLFDLIDKQYTQIINSPHVTLIVKIISLQMILQGKQIELETLLSNISDKYNSIIISNLSDMITDTLSKSLTISKFYTQIMKEDLYLLKFDTITDTALKIKIQI